MFATTKADLEHEWASERARERESERDSEMSETVLSPHTVSFHTEPSACKLLCYLQKLPKVTILLQDDMV